jgi:sugar (pentulose or hexulose) kinase
MGLVLQPYWTPGPEMAPHAKGAIIGFGDVHKRNHLYRAMIEGLIYALKDGAELTEKKNGIQIDTLRVTGGGSQSDAVVQMTADIFGLPTQRPHTHETSLLGAAIDAFVGLGVYRDFQRAVAAMTRVGQLFEPDPANHQIYQELYNEVYRKMYSKLNPLYKNIMAVTGYPE